MNLRLLKTMGYVDYFLIVWDFIKKYARDNDIMVGPEEREAPQEALWLTALK